MCICSKVWNVVLQLITQGSNEIYDSIDRSLLESLIFLINKIKSLNFVVIVVFYWTISIYSTKNICLQTTIKENQ